MKMPNDTIAVISPQDADNSSVMAPLTDDQKKLRALVSRRHPEYEDTIEHWNFLEETYGGGREWFEGNIFKYMKEGDTEFAERLARCYRFNHSREVVDLLTKYLFKQHIVRNEENAPESVKKFWKKATKSGLSIRDLVRQICKRTSVSGRIGIVIDNTRTGSPDAIVSMAAAAAANIRTYAYLVGPDQLLDYSFDDVGELNWALIKEYARDDEDPLTSSGAGLDRFRLWTKTDWRLFEEQTQGRKKIIVEIDSGTHALGMVPLILADNFISDEQYVAPALIDDIAYLDRAVANYLSNLDAIIQDQTFSQLAMPAQNLLPGEDSYKKLVEIGTKRIFLYDGEGGAVPFFLSPDVKQAELILSAINKIINEIYHTVGMAGERTKQDNAVGTDNSSGVAKAYDFERVNALLAAKADSLEMTENRMARLVAAWNGETMTHDMVSYPDDFDTRGLYDEFDIAARLALIEAPDEIRREQMKMVLDKLFPQLEQGLKDKIVAGLKEWPISLDESMAGLTGSGGIPVKTDKGSSPKDKRQGQVTKDSK